MTNLEAAVQAWKSYFSSAPHWQALTHGLTPKETGCGLVYELPNPIDRPHESFAIADMRSLAFAEPHYHPNETEIYIVLEGSGLVVVGGKEQIIKKGSVVITPPDTAHFTIPDNNLVLAAINTPPFKSENYIVLGETNLDVGFDQEQFLQFTARVK